MGKIVAKKALVGKILTKKKLVAGEILAKKKFVSGLVPTSKTVPIIKKVSAWPRSRQGPRQEDRSEPREQCNQGQRQACWTRARKRPGKAASSDREGQRVVSEPSFWTENQQMKADMNSSKIESSRPQEQEKEQRLGARREKPNMEPLRTVRPRGRNRASPMAGTRSCTSQPQGAREGIPRTTRDQVDLHLKERAKEEKTQSP